MMSQPMQNSIQPFLFSFVAIFESIMKVVE